MPSSLQPVSRTDLEALLRDLPGNAREGFFGPASVSWRVNRESAVFLGAGRAALLQIAHPWVAAALVQHSNLLHDALGRFHSTFRVVYTMLFGTTGQALAAARQLHTRHSTVTGRLPGGKHYQANEVGALLWVYATLVESAVMAYEFALGPLTAGELARYYAESKRMAALFGIPSNALPPDWAGFSAYTGAMLASPTLEVDAAGRRLGASVLSGAGTAIRPPHWYRALTAGWLPERLRAQFGLPFGAGEQQAMRRAERWVPGYTASCRARCGSWGLGTKRKRVCGAANRAGPCGAATASGWGQSGCCTRGANRASVSGYVAGRFCDKP